jgi:hypothetical protein
MDYNPGKTARGRHLYSWEAINAALAAESDRQREERARLKAEENARIRREMAEKRAANERLAEAEEERMHQNRIRRMQTEGEKLRLKFAKTNNTAKFMNNHGNENLRSKAVREARMAGYRNLNAIAGSPYLQKTILNRLSKGGKKKTRKAHRRT